MNTPSFDDILDEHRPRIVFGGAHAECSCGRWQHEQMEIAAREVLTPIRGLIEKWTAPTAVMTHGDSAITPGPWIANRSYHAIRALCDAREAGPLYEWKIRAILDGA